MSGNGVDGIVASDDWENWSTPEYGPCPAIAASVAGIKSKLILDTGAEISFLSRGQIDLWNSRESSGSITVEKGNGVRIHPAFGAETAYTENYARIPVNIGKNRYLWKFAVVKGHVNYVLIGIDFLEKFARGINFAEKRIEWRATARSQGRTDEDGAPISCARPCEGGETREADATLSRNGGSDVDNAIVGTESDSFDAFHRMVGVAIDTGPTGESEGGRKTAKRRVIGESSVRAGVAKSSLVERRRAVNNRGKPSPSTNDEEWDVPSELGKMEKYMDKETVARFHKAKIRSREVDKRSAHVEIKFRAAVGRLLDQFDRRIDNEDETETNDQNFVSNAER